MSIHVQSVSWVVIVHCQGHAWILESRVTLELEISRRSHSTVTVVRCRRWKLVNIQSFTPVSRRSFRTLFFSSSCLSCVRMAWDWQPTGERRIRKRKNKPARHRKIDLLFLTRSKSTHIRDCEYESRGETKPISNESIKCTTRDLKV